jgi:hypothetical protein
LRATGYDKDLQTPHLLTRDDLASQVRRYVETFNLNVINSARITWTEYDERQEVDNYPPDTGWPTDGYIETSRPRDRDRVSKAEYAGDQYSLG